MVFPPGSSAVLRGVPVHPTQLYDITLALVCFAVLKVLDRREALRPFLFPIFLIIYGTSRFLTETLRPEFANGWSHSQVLEVLAVSGVTVMLISGRRAWLAVLEVPQGATR